MATKFLINLHPPVNNMPGTISLGIDTAANTISISGTVSPGEDPKPFEMQVPADLFESLLDATLTAIKNNRAAEAAEAAKAA